MSEIEKIRLFDNQKVRTIWVEEEEDWYFSVKDVVTILTETTNAKDYISKMRRRDEELSKGWGQIVHPPLQFRLQEDLKKKTAPHWKEYSALSSLSHQRRLSHLSNGWPQLQQSESIR